MKKTPHNLRAWQLSRRLVKDIYLITDTFPKAEQFGLTAQLRRADVSIPSNIAKGAARNTVKEFRYIPVIARGSLAKVETQLFLANDLGYYPENSGLSGKLSELFGVIGGLIKDARR